MDVISSYFASLFRPEHLALDITAQVLGLIGMIVSLSSFQCRTQKSIMILQTVSTGIFMSQYILLGAFAGLFMNLLAMIRSFVYVFRSKYKWVSSVWTAALFATLCVTLGLVLTFGLGETRWTELLPMCGMVLTTFAGRCKEAKNVRILTLINSPFWFTYNILCRALVGAVTEVCLSASIITAMIRLDLKNKEAEKPTATE